MPMYRVKGNKRDRIIIDPTITVIDYMGHLGKVKGEIGIEIEVEGENLPQKLPEFWRVTRDGSLRGVEAYEYVIKQPITRRQVSHALRVFKQSLERKKAKVEDSGRAGVHVHINFQEVPLRNLASMVCLYYIFEDALTQFCGETRTGNLFCLGTRYAENVIRVFIHYIKYGSVQVLNSDEIRYASLNLKALINYGSLEFRSMRGTIDPVLIGDWIKILLKLKDAALEYDNPRKILEDFSFKGIEGFTKSIFGNMTDKVMKYIDAQTMMEAMWRTQPICYARDWDKPKEPQRQSRLVEKPKEAALVGVEELLKAFNHKIAQGPGAWVVDGRLIDDPVAVRFDIGRDQGANIAPPPIRELMDDAFPDDGEEDEEVNDPDFPDDDAIEF